MYQQCKVLAACAFNCFGNQMHCFFFFFLKQWVHVMAETVNSKLSIAFKPKSASGEHPMQGVTSASLSVPTNQRLEGNRTYLCHPGYCNTSPQTMWLKSQARLTVWESSKSRSRHQQVRVWWGHCPHSCMLSPWKNKEQKTSSPASASEVLLCSLGNSLMTLSLYFILPFLPSPENRFFKIMIDLTISILKIILKNSWN